jgi:hypothetical protein
MRTARGMTTASLAIILLAATSKRAVDLTLLEYRELGRPQGLSKQGIANRRNTQ